MEAFKVNVDLILLHMDHEYKGLHLHSYQMEQRGDELLLMKFKGGLFNRKLTANQYVGLHLVVVFKWNRGGMSFCLWSLRGDYLIENWLPIRGIIGIQLAEPWGNEGSDEFCGTTKIFWPSSPLLPGNKQSIITSPKVKYFSLSYASLSWMKTWCYEAAKVTAWSDFWALD